LKEQKEIEMVVVVNGTSWVGFGWRPKKLTAECRKFPVLHDIGFEASAEPEPSSAEPTSEPSSEPKSSAAEPTAEVASEPKPTAEVASEPEPTAEVASEPSPETASEPTPEVSSKKAEQLTAASSKSKRVAAPQSGVVAPQIPASKDEYTVSTSVSYRVSSVAGRRKRAVEKGKIKFPIELIPLLTREFTLPSKLEENFIQSHTI
jgi:outer membrane biosynthesis protein TonB